MANDIQISQFPTSAIEDTDYLHTKKSTGADSKTTFQNLKETVIAAIPSSETISDFDVTTTISGSDYIPIEDVSEGDLEKITLSNLTKEIGKLLFPVGSIYCNHDSTTNPSTLLGFGTWAQIRGRFLVGSDTSGIFSGLGSTGGSTSHSHSDTFSTESAGAHDHTVDNDGWGAYQISNALPQIVDSGRLVTGSGRDEGGESLESLAESTTSVTTSTHAGHSHGIDGSVSSTTTVPPYIVVTMWRRTA